MIGPFKPAPGNFKCVFVLIDKFSKWIEYMPLTKASSEKAIEFLDQIIHRFSLPTCQWCILELMGRSKGPMT
jgi:hypothetical protein